MSDDNSIIKPITVNLEAESGVLPKELPVMALRNATLFPGTVLPVTVGRAKSKALIADVAKNHDLFVAVSQRDDEVDDPSLDDLYKVGVTARIVKVLTLPDNSMTVILHGVEAVDLTEQVSDDPYIVAKVKRRRTSKLTQEQEEKLPVLISSLKDLSVEMFRLMDNAPAEAGVAIRNIEDSQFLVNFIASNIEATVNQKYDVVSCSNLYKRASKLLTLVEASLEFLHVKEEIEAKARKGMDKQQRDYMLQQQMQVIQNELGDNPQANIVKEFRDKAKDKKWNDKIADTFNRELGKFERINSNSAEYSILQNYLETMLKLPWGEYSIDDNDLGKARQCLDHDHFGLEKVKERILEHLAVLKLKGDLKSPILCLYGPPGVGKTSLGKSIATALGRKYVRMSLGGLHDEAEIRGHRRTYIGAMPGRIIENIKNAGTSNPVFILDEIDKITADFHGDPASALLEVLDPEQNVAFHDNYLDLDYDLSKVMFIATANNVGAISGPLLDRMELIDVDGYLQEEKIEIAKRHLLPKQKENHGLEPDAFAVPDNVMAYIIEKYTRESGVRTLDKTLAKICRKIALNVAEDKPVPAELTIDMAKEFLGMEKVSRDVWEDLKAGVVTGLAWTAVGGEILFVECAASAGKGKVTLTGKLGDVMKESAVLAIEYVRSNAALFGLEKVDFDSVNFHIHVPEGAVPKDGPSAGITMVTSIISALTGRRVKKRLAMTGEITLRGKVLPVGGITEKMLAAKRAGITDIILCRDNEKDIKEIKQQYVQGLNFHFVDYIREVIAQALEAEPTDTPAHVPSIDDAKSNSQD